MHVQVGADKVTKLLSGDPQTMDRISGGQTGEWALVQAEQMSPLLTREKFH